MFSDLCAWASSRFRIGQRVIIRIERLRVGASSFKLIELLLGHRLIERWQMWKPSIDMLGYDVCPPFEELVQRMRIALDSATAKG